MGIGFSSGQDLWSTLRAGLSMPTSMESAHWFCVYFTQHRKYNQGKFSDPSGLVSFLPYPNEEDVISLRNVTTVGVMSQKTLIFVAFLHFLSFFISFSLRGYLPVPILMSHIPTPHPFPQSCSQVTLRRQPRHRYVPNCFLAHMLPGQQTFPYTCAP